ncbi:MAG: iron ABC transporter permease [Acidobacteria bacterium]|nr:MAG: iron ABC transporter permease [Acidobacteriota bacterium]
MAPRPRVLLVVAAFAGLPFAAAMVGLAVGGAAGITPLDALRTLVGLDARTADPALVETIVWQIRAPRVVLLLLAGAALAGSGAALQACLENPLAAPSLLGLSSGASLGAVTAYVSGLALTRPLTVPALAFVGALAALCAVYAIAWSAGRPTPGALLLTGVAVGSLCSSLVSVLLLAAGSHRIHEIFAWLLGSAEGRTWQHVRLALAPVCLGLALLFVARRVIDALALGEEHAIGSGVDVLRARAGVFAAIALASGGAVSVVGPIAFVGLMVPHAVRGLVGAPARVLLPASALGGAGFLVLCDALARVASRSVDVPVGVVTALAGVPFFLVLLHRSRRT